MKLVGRDLGCSKGVKRAPNVWWSLTRKTPVYNPKSPVRMPILF